MTIEELKNRYFWLQANDATTKTEPEPHTFEKDSSVTALIDMREYMQVLLPEINKLKNGDFLYIAGWVLGWLPRWGFFGVDATQYGPGSKKFTDLLIEKAKAGVDVRVLGWVSYAGMAGFPMDGHPSPLDPLKWKFVPEKYNLAKINGITMNSVRTLRTEPKMAYKAWLNMLSHPAGSVHIKMVILGNDEAIGFTGGLDLSLWRWAEYGHMKCPSPNLLDVVESLDWHDVQAMVKGRAVQALYDLFQDMWNEHLTRTPYVFALQQDIADVPSNFLMSSREKDATKEHEVKTRPLAPLPPGTSQQCIQSLRTIPAFKFKKLNWWTEGKPYSQALDGKFELKAAWRKAILGAQHYIYIENNSFMSQEILLWINQAIKNNPNLRVILLQGGGTDPADPVVQSKKQQALIDYTINDGLLKDIATDQNSLKRIRMFQAWGTTVNICQANPLSKDFTTTPEMPIKEVHSISSTESKVVTGWVWDGEKGSLAKKIEAVAGIDVKELKLNVLRERSQLRIGGGPSYKVLGNPLIKYGQQIAFNIEHGNLPPYEPGGYYSPAIPPPPQPGQNVSMHITFGIYVHAKITVIDDNWAMIGSNNVWRRHLYTDWEHAVSFVDGGGKAVKELRVRLWKEHFRVGTQQSQVATTFFDITDMSSAVLAWFDDTKLPQRDVDDPAPNYLRKIALPIAMLKPDNKTLHEVMEALDDTFDPDSRKPWGGVGLPKKI